MSKRKIRLTESQLVNLIKKSLVLEEEPAPAGGIATLTDTEIQATAKFIADLMSGDVEDDDILKIQTKLDDYIFNAQSSKKKCALERLEMFYTSEANQYDDWKSGDTGDSNTLIGDLEEATVETPALRDDLVKSIKENKDVFCKTFNTPTPTPTPQGSTSSAMDCAGRFNTYGEGENQYGEMEWQGGKLSFYLHGKPLGDGAPTKDNVMFEKGGKKWTTYGYCSPGGPGKQRGLILGSWTLKTN